MAIDNNGKQFAIIAIDEDGNRHDVTDKLDWEVWEWIIANMSSGIQLPGVLFLEVRIDGELALSFGKSVVQ
jgi:hypothetical protein